MIKVGLSGLGLRVPNCGIAPGALYKDIASERMLFCLSAGTCIAKLSRQNVGMLSIFE